jgi:hypothetical protein
MGCKGYHKGLITSNTASEGALGEMLVVADLMYKGYQVFRAVSPSADFDLIVSKGGELKRVEVTKGSMHSGKLTWPAHPKPRDILAVWLADKTVIYFPPLEVEAVDPEVCENHQI